jgi:hypothetical protein
MVVRPPGTTFPADPRRGGATAAAGETLGSCQTSSGKLRPGPRALALVALLAARAGRPRRQRRLCVEADWARAILDAAGVTVATVDVLRPRGRAHRPGGPRAEPAAGRRPPDPGRQRRRRTWSCLRSGGPTTPGSCGQGPRREWRPAITGVRSGTSPSW